MDKDVKNTITYMYIILNYNVQQLYEHIFVFIIYRLRHLFLYLYFNRG